MMRRILFAITVLVFPAALSSQPTDWAKVHELTVRGIDQLYNLEMEEAERTFDEVIRMAPNDARGYFFKGMIHFWIFSLNKDPEAYARFFELADRVIAICERERARDKNDLVATFFLGGIYGYRGLAHQRNGSMLKAAWDGRKGYSLLKDAVTAKPDLYDAQMGFGLYSYLVGKVPASYRWLLNILGFSGDVEGGLQALRVAAEHGTYARAEAMFFLSTFLNIENRHEEARAYLLRLIDTYPENTLFLVTAAQWELRQNRVDEALALAQRAVAINNRKKVQIGDEFAYSVAANCYFLKNDFPAAMTNFEHYLQATENKDNVPNSTYYRLGVCYDIVGQRTKAVTTYRRVRKTEPHQWDYHYFRRSHVRAQLPLTEADVLLVKAENAASLDDHRTALSLYKEALKRNPDTDQLALALYGVAQAHHGLQQYEEAIGAARMLVALKPSREQWVVPHGYYVLGQAHARRGEVSEARRAFEAVGRFKNYDFQSRLQARVEREMKRLDGAG
jgi:tetratricopeptide (TPR) repeat protein